MKSYAEIEGSIDKINGSIFASLSDSNSNGNKEGIREKIDSLKANSKALSAQKEEYKMKHLSMIDKRNDILTVSRGQSVTLSDSFNSFLSFDRK